MAMKMMTYLLALVLGVATATRDEDDLPEFSFSGNPNSSGQKNPAQAGFMSKHAQINQSAPVHQMRQVIYRYGQTAAGDDGAQEDPVAAIQPSAAMSGQHYGGQWRLDAPRSRGF